MSPHANQAPTRAVLTEDDTPALPILVHPDARLRRQAEPVTRFDANLARLAQAMVRTMHEAGGIGLAAPQVNRSQRLVVMHIGEDVVALANPRLLATDGQTLEVLEGCLSIPLARAAVPRAARVVLQAQDLAGQPLELELEGLEAVCIQHEIDHLDGILFIDRLLEAS